MNPGTVARRLTGALRLVAGLGLAVTMAIQIGERVAKDIFDPWEYFSYFTIETSLLNIVVLVMGGLMALRRPVDTVLYTTVRMAAVAYAIVTAGVFNLLLRDAPSAAASPTLEWPNEVMHVWIPAFIVLDWLLAPGRPALPWKALRVIAVYPVAWLVYTLARGALSGGEIYPYPFIDPATAGWGSVIVYIVALTAVLLVLGALAIAYGRIGRRRPVSTA